MAPTTRAAVVLAVLLGVLPGVARAGGDVPADRRPLSATEGRRGNVLEPLDLPPAPADADADVDAGQVRWVETSPAQRARTARMEMVGSAYGLAGAMAGMTGTFLLVSMGQTTEAGRDGWRTASYVTAGVAVAALATGTVLWLTAPDAPVRAALAPEAGGLRLTVRF